MKQKLFFLGVLLVGASLTICAMDHGLRSDGATPFYFSKASRISPCAPRIARPVAYGSDVGCQREGARAEDRLVEVLSQGMRMHEDRMQKVEENTRSVLATMQCGCCMCCVMTLTFGIKLWLTLNKLGYFFERQI